MLLIYQRYLCKTCIQKIEERKGGKEISLLLMYPKEDNPEVNELIRRKSQKRGFYKEDHSQKSRFN